MDPKTLLHLTIWIVLGVVSVNAFGQASVIRIDSSNEYETPTPPVHSAIAVHCVNAVGAASSSGGINVGTQDPICQHLTMAEVALEAFNLQAAWCANEQPECDPALMEEYLLNYRGHLESANRITEQTSLAGQLGVTTLDALPFLGLLWLLVFL